MTALTTTELGRLEELEAVVNRGLQTFVEVGSALKEIRDARLYRGTHGTFEDYLRERWQMSRSRAHRLIDAADTVSVLPNGNIPTNEAQARPLTKLPPEDQGRAWERAQTLAEAEDRRVAARHVEAAVAEVKTQARPEPPGAGLARKPLPSVAQLRELIRWAAGIGHITDDQIAALHVNDMVLEHVRRVHGIMARIISHHDRRSK